MELVPIDENQLRRTMSAFSEVDQGLILEYCARIQTILNDLAASGQELTIVGASAGESAVLRIQQFLADRGANRVGFQTDMDTYVSTMQANRSLITQLPRDTVQVYGVAMTTGVISTGTLYGILWWNFTNTISTIFSLIAANPLSAAALGGITTLELNTFSLTDYLKLALMERPQFSSYDEFSLNAGLERMTENTALESSGLKSYVYSFWESAKPIAFNVIDQTTGNLASYTDKMARLKYEEAITSADQLFNVRDQFINVTLLFTSMMILLLVILWGSRYSRAKTFRSRTAGRPNMIESPMGGRVPRRRSRSRRMNTSVKRKGSPKRRKSTRRKSRSPKRKSTRRKSTRRKNSPKRKSKSKRRKSRRKSKSKRRKSMPKRKSKSRRRKSRRKSKTPKRKSKSKRRKSRRKSKSPKRKSTRKGQVRKTSRRAYMDLKTKPARRSRSRRRKDMM
jgi:hypothetical protein